jgi:type IX secretion system PorP/SprF family membrane protein
MRKIITIIFLVLFCILQTSIAQQLGFYSMYQNNWQIINPAAPHMAFIISASTENVLNIAYRQQWIGVKGSPLNYNIHFEHKVPNDKDERFTTKWGLGMYGESAGPLINNTFYFNYAYPISLGGKYRNPPKLYIGFNAGYFHHRINFSNITFENRQESTIINFENQYSFLNGRSVFELTPAIFYINTDRSESYYIGLSSPRLLTAGKNVNGFEILNNKPQVHLIAGFFNQAKTLQPSIWLRWQPGIEFQSLVKNLPLSMNVNLRSKLTDRITIGGGLSTGRWAHLECGWSLTEGKKSMGISNTSVNINFAYDIPLAKTGFQLGQTAEVNAVVSF